MSHLARADQGPIVEEYAVVLAAKSAATADAYLRAVRQMLVWLNGRPGHADGFHPE